MARILNKSLAAGKIRAAVALGLGLLVIISFRIRAERFGEIFLNNFQINVSGGLIKYFCVTIFSISLLGMIIAFMLRAGKKYRSGDTAQDGTVILEFALVLLFALMIILIIVQSCLLMIGNICVHNAAFNAARAAIVYIPADYSDSEPPGYLNEAGEKFTHIKKAACWAVLPVSYAGVNIDPETDESLSEVLTALYEDYGENIPRWVRHRPYLLRKLAYSLENTTVEIAQPENTFAYQSDEDIKVKVEHDFFLAVPYADRLMSVDSDYVPDIFGNGKGNAIKMTAQCRLTNEGIRSYIELESFWELFLRSFEE